MAYTKITRTAYRREALAYALNGKGHDGSRQRNLYVGSVNMMPPNVASCAEQMNRYWVRADGKNKTQVNRIIASFSPGELNPDDPESPLHAAQICDAFVREYYPGRQAVICIQNDGEGHKLHAHVLVSNVSMCEVKLPGEKRAQKPYAGCRGYQLKFDYVKANFNRVAEQYITLDQGEEAADKATQYERRMRQHNKQLAPGEQAKYIWKDDLKERVKKAMSEASDRGDFLRKLTENGVEGSFHETKKGRRYYTYELTDISGFGGEKVPQNLKARSYKLGTDYDYETIQAMLPDDPSPMPKAAGIQDAPQAPSAPHAGHQGALMQECLHSENGKISPLALPRRACRMRVPDSGIDHRILQLKLRRIYRKPLRGKYRLHRRRLICGRKKRNGSGRKRNAWKPRTAGGRKCCGVRWKMTPKKRRLNNHVTYMIRRDFKPSCEPPQALQKNGNRKKLKRMIMVIDRGNMSSIFT